MLPGFVLLCLAAAAIPGCLMAQDSAADPVRKRYGTAVREFNAGRIAEARRQLEGLQREHPEYFRGYRVYWETVGRTESSALCGLPWNRISGCLKPLRP
jgi:predicted Zn-dependent protease